MLPPTVNKPIKKVENCFLGFVCYIIVLFHNIQLNFMNYHRTPVHSFRCTSE